MWQKIMRVLRSPIDNEYYDQIEDKSLVRYW